MRSLTFSTSISEINRIGVRRSKALSENEIHSVQDLLYTFPRRHLDRRSVSQIKSLQKDTQASIVGAIQSMGEKPIRRGKLFQVILSDGTGLLTLTWFNGAQYIKKLFKVGDRLAVHGKIEYYQGFSITHPDFDRLSKQDDPVNTGAILPLYPLTKSYKSVGLEQRIFRKIILEVFEDLGEVPELFTEEICKSQGLISRKEALHQIHFPKNEEALDQAIYRLKFEEHFFLQLLMAFRKITLKRSKAKAFTKIGPYVKLIEDDLPFTLTDAQKKVILEIRDDMKKNQTMNRLLQGDVGSGKTIVAILSMLIAVGNKSQIALMAPTEILAHQHYESVKAILDKVNVPCALLVGQMKKSERQAILNGLENGTIPVLIGTHALIQDDVIFKELGLVIVDEQHRFGVKQRGKLTDKGLNPHFLAMTATPIPRTLSITFHGDMDLSIIDELPKNRKPVVSKVIEEGRLESVYTFMKAEVGKGHQCMVIYPLVEESEKSDLIAAVDAHQKLDQFIFPKINVGLIHGRMKTEEKDEIMAKFAKNEINILVSTTVIEVGVDIPNATVMLIEHAERFGLTQLHQLRGRVGRGAEKSYCIMVRRKFTETSKTRLAIMERTNDGFVIADEDLKLRGPGEFFGIRQSGFLQFRIANLLTDGPIIRSAREAAFSVAKSDPNLLNKDHKIMRETFMKDYADRMDFVQIS